MKAYWANAAGGNFFVAANWSDDQVPDSNDIASMTLPYTYMVSDSVPTTVLGIATGTNTTFTLTGGVIFAATEGTATGVNRGALVLDDGTEFKTSGTFDNIGVISVAAATHQTFLLLLLPSILDGGGAVELQNSTNAIIDVQDSLTNVDNTIEGAGNIEDGGQFINAAKGTVAADAPGGTLTILTPTQNAGLLEALGFGTLDIFSNVTNAATGIIEAGHNGSVDLGNADIQGGTLEASAPGATMDVVGTATLDGTGSHPVTIEGTLGIDDSESLTLAGTIDNAGTIDVSSTGDATSIKLGISGQSTVTLQGGGNVSLDPTNSLIASSNLANLSTLNNVDNTISGAGLLEHLILNNENNGKIDANAPADLLELDGIAVSNAGLLTATNGGELQLFDGTVANSTTGIIEAGTSSTVNLTFGNIITGGTLTTTGSGEIDCFDNELQALTIAGTVVDEDGESLLLSGTIHNTGTLSLDATTVLTSLELTGTAVTLTGNGKIILPNANALIETQPGAAAPAELVNNGNTISGGGFIDNVVLNNGKGSLIDANESAPLVVDTGNNAVVNGGTLQSEFGEELYVGSPINNSGAINAFGTIAIAGPMTGKGTAEIGGGGELEFGAASAASVTFANTSGELILDDSRAYTGTISGFADNTQSIDLADIDEATAVPTFSGTTLTVTDGFGDVAKLKLGGKHTLASFALSNDGGGGTLITDPSIDKSAHVIADGATLEIVDGATGKVTFAGPTGTLQIDTTWSFAGKVAGFGAQDRIDLADVAFGAQTTLGYARSGSAAAKLTVSDGIHTANIALLGQYMASSFAAASDGHGGTLITEVSQTAQQPLVTQPHA